MKNLLTNYIRRAIGYSVSVAILLFIVTGCDNVTSPDASISQQPDDTFNQIHSSNLSQVNPTFAEPGDRPDVIEGHYIVVLSTVPAVKNPRAAAALEALSKDVGNMQGARLNRTYKSVITGFAAELSDDQVEQLRRDPRVQSVEQDRYAYPTSDFNLQEYPTWGLDRIDQRELLIDRGYAYTATGTGVTAYIIDSGIRYSHSEFGGRASLGYDFVLEEDPDNTDPSQGPGEDCSGHGTHVAGTVGGSTYGVAKNVNLVSVRVFGCTGGAPWSRIIAGIEWVTINAVYPAVSNMSIGGWARDAVDTAVENSIATGIHYTVAAGNNSDNACLYSPARTSGALTAGASQVGDYRASFSNYGECVDIYAPGASITSASHSGDSSVLTASGTSMAAPHTAGLAALYLETNPDVTPSVLHTEIINNSTKNAVSNVPSGTNHLVHSLWESAEFEPLPPQGDINLVSTDALKEKGNQVIDLTWKFDSQNHVQIIRNNSFVTVWYNSGEYRDDTGEKGNDGSYIHQVCEMYFVNNTCSNELTTIFGDGDGGGDDGEEPFNDPPTAEFTYQADGLTVQFTDASTDSDGTITAWIWNFGDGASSTVQHPVHTYAADGTYTVSLTVTDNNGDTGTTSKNVTVGGSDDPPPPTVDITLSAEGYKVQGRWRADLSWTPSGTSASVDVYRDGSVIATTQNDGSYTDVTNFRGGGSLTYKVCEAGTDTCSNEVTVEF